MKGECPYCFEEARLIHDKDYGHICPECLEDQRLEESILEEEEHEARKAGG